MTGTNGKAITSVALYARVSTLDKGQDPQMQLRELRAHAQAQGWTVYSEYVDKGISGSKDSRPALNRMMADAQARQFDAVLCWKLDRFSRSLKHLINSLETLAVSAVSFVSLRDNLDLTTAAGRLMFQMIGAFAEFEREITRERVRAGLQNARAKGKQLGRRARTDIDVSALLALRSAGLSWRKIAAQTGIPMSTVKDRCAVNPQKLGVCA
jgi:DNA invertase Pin-like site-specific DNA recombinase